LSGPLFLHPALPFSTLLNHPLLQPVADGNQSNLLTFAHTNKTSPLPSPLPEVKEGKVYSHDNKKLVDVEECTKDQLHTVHF
jgi:hypothetical protein